MDWVPIYGFPSYSVNPLGQVRHDRIDRLVTPVMNRSYSVYVSLWRSGRHVKRSLSLLVASHFIQQPNEYFDTVINLNGDRFDCAVVNLAWRPRWFSIQYHRNFRDPYVGRIEAPLRARDGVEVFPSSIAVSVAYGLLEREVVLSVWNMYPVWPTNQIFELA